MLRRRRGAVVLVPPLFWGSVRMCGFLQPARHITHLVERAVRFERAGKAVGEGEVSGYSLHGCEKERRRRPELKKDGESGRAQARLQKPTDLL
ncbi:Slit-Robo Rho Gtpase-Activating Protein 2 [Manis pentadactyla]|nr:Slit-Robo Rho Gtpase-Activating Protein 2 [Manis pentadactyla]